MINRDEEVVVFYKTFASLLTRYMKREKITTSQLARKVEQSFKTIDSMLQGRPFYSHQFIWITEETGITIEDIFRETERGKENKEEKGLDLFI